MLHRFGVCQHLTKFSLEEGAWRQAWILGEVQNWAEGQKERFDY